MSFSFYWQVTKEQSELSEATNHKFGKFLGNRLSPEERREALENLFVFGRENQRPFLIRMAVLLFSGCVSM